MTNVRPSAAASGDPVLSPGFADDGAEAFELKFLLDAPTAAAVEAWAHDHLEADPHGDPALAGNYEVSTLYLDTPRFDVFHNAGELDGAKLRLRRYGEEAQVYLERKVRRGDRVRKSRTPARGADLAQLAAAEPRSASPDGWFRVEVAEGGLRPVCCLTYARAAFTGPDGSGRLRLTLDRRIRCATASAWSVGRVQQADASPVAEAAVVCELKFAGPMPLLFKQLVTDFGLTPGRFSKYRNACLTLGLIADGASAHA